MDTYVRKLTTIDADNDLSHSRHHAIIWTNVGILFNGPHRNTLQWNVNRNVYICIQEDTFKYRQEIACHFVSAYELLIMRTDVVILVVANKTKNIQSFGVTNFFHNNNINKA